MQPTDDSSIFPAARLLRSPQRSQAEFSYQQPNVNLDDQLVSLAINQLIGDLARMASDGELAADLRSRLVSRLRERWDPHFDNSSFSLPDAAGREFAQLAADQYDELVRLLELPGLETDPAWYGYSTLEEVTAEQAVRACRLQVLCAAIRCNLQPDEWWLFRRRLLQRAEWPDLARELSLSPQEVERRLTLAISDLKPRLQRYVLWLKLRPCNESTISAKVQKP